MNCPCISVVIPTYNRAQMLGITLESFLSQEYPSDKYEIIVVDNNSADQTRSVVNAYKEKAAVRIVYLFEPRQGVHYARNAAIRAATFDILYYTDDDMIADRMLLKEIVKPFVFDAGVGAATGSVLPRWEVPPPRWVLKHCQNSWLSLFVPSADFLVGTERWHMNSCHEAVKKEALIRAGGFHPENTGGVWIGDGESGTNQRIHDLGYKSAYTKSAVIYHMIPQSRMTQAYLNKRLGNEGRCNSFTGYRKDPTLRGIWVRMLHRMVVKAPKLYLKLVLRAVRYADTGYLRFCLAYCHYFFHHAVGDMRFLTSRDYRALALRDTFIE